MEALDNDTDTAVNSDDIVNEAAMVTEDGVKPVPQASTISEIADTAVDNHLSNNVAVTSGSDALPVDSGYIRMVDDVPVPEMPPPAPSQESIQLPPEAPTSADISLLRNSGGYTPAQVNAFIDRQRPKWYAANYDDAAIDNYYGVEPFDVKGMINELFSALDTTLQSGRTLMSEGEADISDAGHALSGYSDALVGTVNDAATALDGDLDNAGNAIAGQFEGGPPWHDILVGNWQQSMTSKVARMNANDHSLEIELPADDQIPFLKKTVGDLVKFAGDAPPEVGIGAAIMAGAAGVLNPVTFPIALIVAGGVGLSSPDLLRRYINKSYLAGRAENVGDFLHLAAAGVNDFKHDIVKNSAFMAAFSAAGIPLGLLEKVPGAQTTLQSKPVLFVVNRLKNMLQAGIATWATSGLPGSYAEHPTMREYLEYAFLAAFLPRSESDAGSAAADEQEAGKNGSEEGTPAEASEEGQRDLLNRPSQGTALTETPTGADSSRIVENMMRLNEAYGTLPGEIVARLEENPELRSQLTERKIAIEKIANSLNRNSKIGRSEDSFSARNQRLPDQDSNSKPINQLSFRLAKRAEGNSNTTRLTRVPEHIGPGPYARNPIPAGPSPRPTVAQQRLIDQEGYSNGCHRCGTRNPGTRSGHFIGDHQDPQNLKGADEPDIYLPHCLRCSLQQGGYIRGHNAKNRDD